jgi:hypothetical protein
VSRQILTLRGAGAPLAAAPVPTPTSPSADVPRERFWLVWCPAERAPHRRHPTLESARTEAARLGALAPHKEFLVYEATRVASDPPESKE